MHLLGSDAQGVLQHCLGHPLFHLIHWLWCHQAVQGQDRHRRAVAHFLFSSTAPADDLINAQPTQDRKQHWDRTQRLGQLIVNVLLELRSL
jgi:hypothetical protein